MCRRGLLRGLIAGFLLQDTEYPSRPWIALLRKPTELQDDLAPSLCSSRNKGRIRKRRYLYKKKRHYENDLNFVRQMCEYIYIYMHTYIYAYVCMYVYMCVRVFTLIYHTYAT